MSKDVPNKTTPKLWDEIQIDEILDKLKDGYSLSEACRELQTIARSTFLTWVSDNVNELFDRYTRARHIGADVLFDELIDIADDGTNDWVERDESRGGGYEINGEAIQRSKLRINTRQWSIARINQGKYGSKVELDHTTDGFREVLSELSDKLPD